MQLNKIKKQTFAAFDSHENSNGNEFMSDFKNHLTEILMVDKVTIIGFASGIQDKKNVTTIYFAYVAPKVKEVKPKKKKTQKSQ